MDLGMVVDDAVDDHRYIFILDGRRNEECSIMEEEMECVDIAEF
jgi:hypothetical protein